MSRTLRWPGALITLTSPPGWYSYQIGVVSGARSGSAVTLRIPTYGSARKASRSSWVMGRMTERLSKPVKERVRERALRVVAQTGDDPAVDTGRQALSRTIRWAGRR